MTVADAQDEMRRVYLGGSIGQIVSGVLWLLSAALATWGTPRAGALMLVVGGMFIFPVTQLVLKISGRPASVGPDNPLRHLAMQVAFIVPLCIPLVAAASGRFAWFYPAFMLLVGAHYLPFIFLYGMRLYGLLAALLMAGALVCGLVLPEPVTGGAWFTGVVLVVFGLVLLRAPVRGAR